MRWDLFCRVIDNHGDVGVCWRLAAELAARGESVRLWLDDPSALEWMAPGGHAGVTVVPWNTSSPVPEPGDVVIEAFGCDPPPGFVGAMAAARPAPVWINLEYLSAEGYVERSHGLPSPVQGPGAGLTKFFFYPGFSARTGGLLREQDLAARRAAFDRDRFLRALGIEAQAEDSLMSLFCYEPGPLPELLLALAREERATRLLITAGRAQAAAASALARLNATHPGWNAAGRLRPHALPLLTQAGYDQLLWACDLNFVRGEDSLVRGLLAGRPLVWHLYPQADGAHLPKLDAFLDWLEAPASLRNFHAAWNATGEATLPALEASGWQATAEAALRKVHALPELAAGLLRFARDRVRI
ncbi:elongation factor P maturation arginine rhamnosyltransferase EarP [Caenimonas sedimenti]|uniref:Protein-arginine rhamnosyltransferase n=1 Tax=Caenimonas sedimenti TaxID=2596921 RepID=A0A562ZVL5_9BURK|nr:elongation factor P maturation arginine rhamnosyltransferase EarP [Caenimonas sedimenti]TWO72642.1 elongation factor P maturation arginine rhamnosyltransferase EarP [Caenimonas sedimenti]